MRNTKKKIIATALTLGMLLPATSTFAYTTKSGDTMNGIAKANGLTLSQLVSYNPQISNPDVIGVGQNINTTTNTTQQTTSTTNNSISASDKDLMARLVRAEAESEPYAGKVAVATVVLNRVDSPDFPNTISGVINQSGQFSPVSNGAINKAADSDSIRAVNEAIVNRGQGKGSLFFYNPKTSTSTWVATREVTTVIGNHTFAK